MITNLGVDDMLDVPIMVQGLEEESSKDRRRRLAREAKKRKKEILSPEELAAIREKNRVYQRQKRKSIAQDELKRISRESKRKQRERLTEEQKAKIRERDRLNKRQQREAKRNASLQQYRQVSDDEIMLAMNDPSLHNHQDSLPQDSHIKKSRVSKRHQQEKISESEANKTDKINNERSKQDNDDNRSVQSSDSSVTGSLHVSNNNNGNNVYSHSMINLQQQEDFNLIFQQAEMK